MILLLPILIPLAAALVILVIPKRFSALRAMFCLAASGLVMLICFSLFGKAKVCALAPIGFGIELTFLLYQFNGFILAASAVFTFLIALYCCGFLNDKKDLSKFFSYLLFAAGFVNGAVLADNLVVMLFFWEGLLLLIFAMIAQGGLAAYKSAIKAFVIIGISDLCLMVGIALVGKLSGSLNISQVRLGVTPLAGLAFIMLMIGAISKAGAMPFHSWIPDAAIDAPLPFMTYFPGALEKLLGIYFLARITLDMFQLGKDSALGLVLMVIGAVTILAAVMMALIQKDYKRLLSYHAISQVGYMLLGIGTCLPIGIIGGLFHMLNNAIYKSCLFLSAGAVERQAGTTDLKKLGGLAKVMPLTFGCFFIAALSISGVPPFNGFFSKELIYDAALERGAIFYWAAAVGSFFTALSFLKLGHAVYGAPLNFSNLATSAEARSENASAKADKVRVKEAPFAMLLPMFLLSAACIFFGLFYRLPLKHFFQPALNPAFFKVHPLNFALSPSLVLITLIILSASVLYHLAAARKKQDSFTAADLIHHAPYLSGVFQKAEAGTFDPYELGLKFSGAFSALLFRLDQAIDWFYNRLSVKGAYLLANSLSKIHSGNYVLYLSWSLIGMLGVILCLLYLS